MKSWLDSHDHGVNFLVRSGSGRVTAVEPVGVQDSDGEFPFQRVEIDCVNPRGWSRSIRFTARAQVINGSTLHVAAMQALNRGDLMRWEIEWHRHEWVPAHVSVTDLDVETDTTARLVFLEIPTAPDLEPADLTSVIFEE